MIEHQFQVGDVKKNDRGCRMSNEKIMVNIGIYDD